MTPTPPPPPPAPGPGLFLALDGPDGGGKTTQAARLVEWLRRGGREVVACRDPGGTPLGDRLRGILLDRAEVPFGTRAEMLLYMASRAQLVEEVIEPALAAGKVVVSDRYLLANVVYQGHAGGLPAEQVWRVGLAATGGRMPDLTLVLDVPAEVASARIGSPRDRMEDRGEAFRRKVRSGFLRELKTYPAPSRLIDASGDADDVAAKIQGEVARVLALREGA
jgi:dTMP kinase